MYRQVLVHPDDRAYQVILWREFQLNTVTYGMASASFLSTRCLVKLASDFQRAYPNSSKIKTQNIYVDDCLTGADTIHDAKILLDETTALLRQGNFGLTKFCSNDQQILEKIPKGSREKMLTNYQSAVIKTLGLVWDQIQDALKFCYPYNTLTD